MADEFRVVPPAREDLVVTPWETVTVTVEDALAFFDKCDLFWLQTREMVACGKTLAEEVRQLRAFTRGKLDPSWREKSREALLEALEWQAACTRAANERLDARVRAEIDAPRLEDRD